MTGQKKDVMATTVTQDEANLYLDELQRGEGDINVNAYAARAYAVRYMADWLGCSIHDARKMFAEWRRTREAKP